LKFSPLVNASEFVLRRYLQFVSQKIRFAVAVASDHASGLEVVPEAEQASVFHKRTSSHSTLIPFWNAHALLLLTSFFRIREHLPSNLEALADDSMGGLITEKLLASVGLKSRSLSFKNGVRRLEAIQELLIQRPSIAMAADSHGPYRAINTGMARLARSYEGTIQPIAAWSNSRAWLFPTIKMSVPLPGTMVVVSLGKPINVDPDATTVADLRQSLHFCLTDLDQASALLGQDIVATKWLPQTI
jgi:lysophospholipid acyltransferase (LPLAT)-like uncharacterized protein